MLRNGLVHRYIHNCKSRFAPTLHLTEYSLPTLSRHLGTCTEKRVDSPPRQACDTSLVILLELDESEDRPVAILGLPPVAEPQILVTLRYLDNYKLPPDIAIQSTNTNSFVPKSACVYCSHALSFTSLAETLSGRGDCK